MKNKKFIIYSLLFISVLLALILSFYLDRRLYLSQEEYAEKNETAVIQDNMEDNTEIKYNWQIAIPKIDVIAPIGEGSDMITLRNRVGHVSGTGRLSRKYLSSSVIIIPIIILQDISILIEWMN